MLLRANALAKGTSGARIETVELLLACLDRSVLPYVPSRGSVGASGDLAPLAHLALPLVGEGEAWFEGVRLTGSEALAQAGVATALVGDQHKPTVDRQSRTCAVAVEILRDLIQRSRIVRATAASAFRTVQSGILLSHSISVGTGPRRRMTRS